MKITRSKKISKEQIEAAEREIVEKTRRIAFYTTEYNIELLANKMDRGEFVIPAYQREYTWDSNRKSRFIESVIMGLPIPFLFFWEMKDGRLEVVDGSQRLRTIQEYILKSLRLGELEELPSLSGTKFSDLPLSRQLKINNLSIRGIVLNEHADNQARFDMFERINTGSLIANTAEVRRGALRGPFQELVEQLATTDLFHELAPVSEKSRKARIPEELIARFFAYGDGLDKYKDSPSRFIFDYTKEMNDRFHESPDLGEVYRQRFLNMLNFVHRVFPYGFRKSQSFKTTPRVRFEAISIGADLAIRENLALLNKDLDTAWIESSEFKEITTTDAANVKSKIENRFNYVKIKLLEND